MRKRLTTRCYYCIVRGLSDDLGHDIGSVDIASIGAIGPQRRCGQDPT